MHESISNSKNPIRAKLQIPGDHEVSCHAILLSALAEGVSELNNLATNRDTIALINALRQLGIVIQLDEATHSCIIAGGNGRFPKKQSTIWCDESLTTARYLLSACAVNTGVFYFDSHSQIRKKTMATLIEIVKRQGAQVIPNDAERMPFTMVGADNLEGGEIIFDETISKVIISSLLMVSPFARTPFTFKGNLKNFAYTELTIAMMAEFGVLVHKIHQSQFLVPVPQRYHAHDYTIEPDFGLAAYFFGAAAMTGGEITIQAIKRTHIKQTQVKFLSVLEKMGCHIYETHQGLTVKGPTTLQGIEVSMRNFSDTFLALASIAPFANSPTRISHLGSLTKKEMYRMQIIRMELSKMGVHIEHGEDWIKIFPGQPQGGLVNPGQDAHLAMAFTLLGLKTPGIILENEKSVMTLHSEFFSLWKKLSEHPSDIKV